MSKVSVHSRSFLINKSNNQTERFFYNTFFNFIKKEDEWKLSENIIKLKLFKKMYKHARKRHKGQRSLSKPILYKF